MTKLKLLRMSCLLALATLGVAACGSDGPPATAKPGSKFCKLAQEARDIGDEVDVNSGDPDQLADQIDAALEAGRAAADAAPKDFESLGKESVESEEAIADLLDRYDYVWVAAFTSKDGKELFADPRYTEIQDERDEYLLDKCEIEPTDDTLGGDIAFSPGDEGIRQLFGLLQLNADAEVTDEQVDCAVDALAGSISDEDIAGIANSGTVSDEGAVAFSQAIADCGIVLPGS